MHCPSGAELEIELRNSAHPAVTRTDAPAIQLAASAFERVVGAAPLFVRSGGTLPIYAGLVARGYPTFATGFGVESRVQRARTERERARGRTRDRGRDHA